MGLWRWATISSIMLLRWLLWHPHVHLLLLVVADLELGRSTAGVVVVSLLVRKFLMLMVWVVWRTQSEHHLVGVLLVVHAAVLYAPKCIRWLSLLLLLLDVHAENAMLLTLLVVRKMTIAVVSLWVVMVVVVLLMVLWLHAWTGGRYGVEGVNVLVLPRW